MAFGVSGIENEAQAYRKNYGNQIPNVTNWGKDWLNQGQGQLDQVNAEIRNYISGLGNDSYTITMKNYLDDVMSGRIQATLGQHQNARSVDAKTVGAIGTGLDMRGRTFAEMFGQQLGGLALQQQNMQNVADKLASTNNNPFAHLNRQAMEDIALNNSNSQQQLRNQLAAQGLNIGSGAGAAALSALAFQNNKTYADAVRQNAVQGAQLQQQGLQAASQIYGQMAGLDLQRGTTAAQLGLQGYQSDLQNAARLDAVNQFNAQQQNAASLQNAQLATQANLQNAQLATNTSMQNAAMQNQLVQTGMQTGLQLQQQKQNQAAQLFGLLSNNAAQVMNSGMNIWNTGYNAESQYMQQLNQMAAAAAEGRGQFWGNLIGTVGNIAGAALGAGGFAGQLLNFMGGNRNSGANMNQSVIDNALQQASIGNGYNPFIPPRGNQIAMPSVMPNRFANMMNNDGIGMGNWGYAFPFPNTLYGNVFQNHLNWGSTPFISQYGLPAGSAGAQFTINGQPRGVVSNTLGGN